MRGKSLRFAANSRLADWAVYLIAATTASAAAPIDTYTTSAAEVFFACLFLMLVASLLVLYAVRPTIRRRADAPVPLHTDLIQTARDAIFVIRRSGEILTANPAAEALFGYALSAIQGHPLTALIPPPSNARRANYLLSSHGQELTAIRKSGERFPIEISISELPELCLSVVIRDRSDARRARLEIEHQRDFAHSLLTHFPALLVVTDHDGRIVLFNHAAEELTQFSEGEIRGQFLWQALAMPSQMEDAEQRFRALVDGEFPARSESLWCLRDNSIRTISWTHSALRDQYGRISHILSAGEDITNRHLAEERRRESQALSTAGRLASGIAHDFNNLLTAITGYSGLALSTLSTANPVRQDIEEIQRAGDRGASLTRQLLAFSGNHPRQTRPIDCNEAVRNIERLLRVMTGDRIQLDFALEPNLPLVLADLQLIEECIMHLVANAKEAMPDGGTLQVQTGLRTLNRTRLDARPPIGPGEFVTISVVDTGVGIPPDALPHIFEPYFTTKQTPIGNGMGLAIVHGIVRQAEGSIVVHSAPRQGSTFRILLPLAPVQSGSGRPEPVSDPALLGDETVLLALEDDTERAQIRESLEAAGYTVLAAANAPEAIEFANQAPGAIHLLISDILLPRMSGPTLAASIQEQIPALRTLFATSRGIAEIERQGLDPHTVLRLDRQSERSILLHRVRESLAAPSRT